MSGDLLAGFGSVLVAGDLENLKAERALSTPRLKTYCKVDPAEEGICSIIVDANTRS